MRKSDSLEGVVVFCRLVFGLLALCGAGAALGDDGSHPEGLRPPLGAVLEQAAGDQLVPVSVILVEQAEVPSRTTFELGDRESHRRHVLDILKNTAARTQAPLLVRLERFAEGGQVANIRPLWIGNLVGVDATPSAIREIAARPEVAWVNYNPKVDVSLGPPRTPQRSPRGLDLQTPSGSSVLGVGVDEIECGVDQMRAPEVWNDLGLTGEGAIIAVVDSGVCWTHPDIANQIWVNPGEDLDGDGAVMDPDDENGIDDDQNGFVDDLIGWNFEVGTNSPDDTNSHGSHVAGTIAGDGTGGTQAGMAPGAKIMVVKVGLTFADEVDVWAGMQYAADNGAHSVSMSLGWPHNQNPDRATWRTNSENAIEAGTAMVIASGNEGSGSEPDNVRTPGDVPRIISVGAVDCSDLAASFSSRGPVTWQDVSPFLDHPYPPGLIKPDVSAPGVGTKSHNICSGYSSKSGTSMATPHVAGAVALMIAADPTLTHDEIKQVLEATSVDLGDPGKDNTFGTGRVDAFAAVDAVFGLSVEDVLVIDSDPALANGDGGIDTGEIVSLAITLKNNFDDRPAENIRGTLTSMTPGVALVHDFATWPDSPAQASVTSDAPHFSVRVDEGCNYPIRFELSLRYNDRDAKTRFEVLVGTHFQRTLISDDMETDQGWSPSGDAVSGQFVREDPQGIVDSSSTVVQPEDDNTPGSGTRAWVTGNSNTIPGSDDVDAGTVRLTSPPLNAADFSELDLSYARHFYALPSTVPATDFFRTLWSTDGQNWDLVEELGLTDNQWNEKRFGLPPAAMVPGLLIRFEVSDDPIVPTDSVVEGLIDDVTIDGLRVECDLFSRPLGQAPNPVGNSLLVRREDDNVRLEWVAPPVDSSHDAASTYTVWSSAAPNGGYSDTGLSLESWYVSWDEALNPETIFYLISAENGGGSSGEAP